MKKTVAILFLLSLFAGCISDSSGQYVYEPPENINDGLEVGTLREVKIDSSLLIKAVKKIKSGRYNEVHSMLIYKDEKLVFEEYFAGHQYQWDAARHHGEWVHWNENNLHPIMSVTKSITSACIGGAIDHGFIKSVHQSIFDYLPQHYHLDKGGKDKITIEHLLTMTPGWQGNEWASPYSNTSNPIIHLWSCEDPIACILESPLIKEPGTHFTYFGGSMIVLGEIIRNATKMDISDFSKKYLFEPLEIDSADWAARFENGVIEAAGGLLLTPRAMVKIGATYLDNGVWDGQRIISEEWVKLSSTAYSSNHGIDIPGEASGGNGYAYSWWTNAISNSGKEIGYFAAVGWGGQNIIILPTLNTVVVFTGGNYVSKMPGQKIVRKYILPAIRE